MKSPIPDDRQTLDELRRILDTDKLPVPDRLRPENLIPTLLTEKPPSPVYRQRWFRPAVATAAAAAVILLLVLPVWDRLTSPPKAVSNDPTAGTIVETNTVQGNENGDFLTEESMEKDASTGQASDAEPEGTPAGSKPASGSAPTEATDDGTAQNTTSCVWSGLETPNMTFDEAKSLLAGGALLIDLRTGADVSLPHLTGSVNIPFADLNDRIREEADTAQPLILYSTNKEQLEQAAGQLAALGYQEIYVLESLP